MTMRIKLTLDMDESTARVLLGIVSNALAQGDINIERDDSNFEEAVIDWHEAIKQSLQAEVLTPIRNAFPT